MKGKQEVIFPAWHTNMHAFWLTLNTSHIEAARHLVRYFIGTKDKGYNINPNNSEGLKVHVDADFSGN